MTKLCKCSLLDTTESDRFCGKELRLCLIGVSLGYYSRTQCYDRTIAVVPHGPEGQWLRWAGLHCTHWQGYAGPTWANLPHLRSVRSWFWAALSWGWCFSTFMSFLGPAVSPRIFFSGWQQTSKRARPLRSVIFDLLAWCLLASHWPSKSHP